MGRLRTSRRKRYKQRQSRQRRPHDSDPEHINADVAEKDTPGWNSLDERGLSPGADYAYNAGLSSDEMEVTRKLSCLNFSMIPCAPSAIILESQDMCVQGRGDGGDIETSDVDHDVYYEQAFATTQHDLLPTLSDKEMETIESAVHDCRQRRKRVSKRKPNRKAKRIKSSANPSSSFNSQTKGGKNSVGFQPTLPLSISFTRSSSKEHPTTLRRAKSFRKPKRSKPAEDPLLGFFSDTSAVCEMDMHQEYERNVDDMFDCTPPTEGDDCASGSGFTESSDMFDQGMFTNESDLTESTTTDSGCEGDDEESSVEGPVSSSSIRRLASWWEKDTMEEGNSDEEKLTRILRGSFPLMSELGQERFKEQLESAMPEFKHPGRFGICRKSGHKKRRPSLHQMSSSPTLREVNQKIVDFVQNSSEMELRFNLVSRALCRTISCMARVYNLQCHIEQKRRLPVASPLLRRTPFTRLASQKEVEPILKSHGRESPTTILSNFNSETQHTHKAHTLPRASASTHAMVTRSGCLYSEQSVVGGEVPALDESNLGNKMLQGMGWKPGSGLGAQGNGIKDPIPAHIRPKYVGLGY